LKTLHEKSEPRQQKMIEISDVVNGFRTPESRWARFGPYYAMFPLDFAFEVIEKYSKEGDYIIDPFAGRCSSVYAGGILGRHSLGIEINPVGWLYGKVKIRPASKDKTINRLYEIYSKRDNFSKSIEQMPLFYRMCYCDEVLKFLLAIRNNLDWKNNDVDATLMSVVLVYLHGKLGEGLSNQMKMTKAMGVNYSIDWWTKKGLIEPPQINPLEFILKKLKWRYAKGLPRVFDSRVVFGDSAIELDKIAQRAQESDIRFSLLFTSPPYFSVTDYFADQWLRIWLLGGPEVPKTIKNKHMSRFMSKQDYYNLLNSVFSNCAAIMKKNSTIYIRTDKRKFTFNTTLEILQRHFPNHDIKIKNRPFGKRTQTAIHGNTSTETGEIDIIMAK